MSLILLPLNPAKDAVLVDINNQPLVTIDDSTPVEVNVQQPISVDDNGGSLTVDGTVGVDDSTPISVEQVTSTDQAYVYSNTADLLEAMVVQLKILNMYMAAAYDEEFTEDDIEE